MARDSSRGISEEVLCAEYEAVYRYILCLCRNDTEAQDLTQETFLRAMKSSRGFEGQSSLYTWLCAIGKNLWLNRCKKQSRETAVDELPAEAATDQSSLEEQLIEKDTAMRIHRVLHHIDEPYKEVFSLRVFGQLPFADIASLFGKTESWARVTYYRAKNQISDKLRKDGYDE